MMATKDIENFRINFYFSFHFFGASLQSIHEKVGRYNRWKNWKTSLELLKWDLEMIDDDLLLKIEGILIVL
jgi:hypothetical protein